MENHLPYTSERREKTSFERGEAPLAAVPPAKKPVRTVPLTEGPNICAGHPAVTAFQALYSGKQRRDAKAWLDYFTSPDFLSVYRERRFAQLLLSCAESCEQPPPREMLNWLYAVYGIFGEKQIYAGPDSSREREEISFRVSWGADFDGLGYILSLAEKGVVPKRSQGNELAIRTSFIEYRRLVYLSGLGSWENGAVGEASRILGRYVLAYLREKCTAREPTDCERHPAGLRLITHFYQTQELPEELYRIAWEKLDLKSALMGRPKVLYGELREIVLARLPGIAGESAENFRQLKSDFTLYAVGCYKRSGSDPERDRAETEAFFAREDFQRALLNRKFVEENLLSTWVDEDRCGCFLQKIIGFYTAHPEAPCAQEVVERAEAMKEKRARLDRDNEDRNAPAPEEIPALSCRPFFRHWINTAFYTARDRESGISLLGLLRQDFSYHMEWSRRFLGSETEVPQPKCLTCTVDGEEITLRFHLRHVDFLLNGELLCRPVLSWELLLEAADGDLFLLLLPITAAYEDQIEEVRRELSRRLRDTAAPEELRERIAACLAGSVCRLWVCYDQNGTPMDTETMPCEWFREDAERLLGCSYGPENRLLWFFEQTFAGRRGQGEETYENVQSVEEAAALAEQLLSDAVSPVGIHLDRLENLPAAVYADPDFMAIAKESGRPGTDMPRALLEAEVTREALQGLFLHFAAGRVRRLELSWPTSFAFSGLYGYEARRSLVFLRESNGYACLYFDDKDAQTYALIARPELYWDLDADSASFVPFRQGRLSGHDVHRSFATIRRHLDTVFSQAGWPNGIQLHAGRIWSYAAAMCHGRHKYNLDKLLLGGFPLERCHNRLGDKFYLACYPEEIACLDAAGEAEHLPIGNINRDRVQAALVNAVQGRLTALCLRWSEGRYVVLRQEEGRFLLLYLDDQRRRAVFHVADKRTYMDVEGKKYPKGVFQGRVTPAYLIHHDAIALRTALEQLLSAMDAPERFVDQFAEFAGESPVKERPYEVVRGEMVLE
jgi:hypothetical protein